MASPAAGDRYEFLSDYDEGDVPIEEVLEACKRARKAVASGSEMSESSFRK